MRGEEKKKEGGGKREGEKAERGEEGRKGGIQELSPGLGLSTGLTSYLPLLFTYHHSILTYKVGRDALTLTTSQALQKEKIMSTQRQNLF